ncbi:hypothetical protein QE152_g31857 [Popillia japonica]|uniref:Uncharacterized protein n=1 Tax=Popillia japonica TaxID=7064 RepID=A0AAW1J174_POPJA
MRVASHRTVFLPYPRRSGVKSKLQRTIARRRRIDPGEYAEGVPRGTDPPSDSHLVKCRTVSEQVSHGQTRRVPISPTVT